MLQDKSSQPETTPHVWSSNSFNNKINDDSVDEPSGWNKHLLVCPDWWNHDWINET